MANCFQDIIGIKGQCGEITPSSSGLYINDLPFMSLKVADAILEDQASGVSFIQDRMNYAVNKVNSELNSLLAPYYKQNSVLESQLFGQIQPFLTAQPAKAVYRGIEIQINKYPYLGFNLTDIIIYSSNFTGNKEIKVFNLITGVEIDSFEIEIVAGEPTMVPINKQYLTNRQWMDIFICYDATDVDTFQTNIYRGQTGCLTCRPFQGYGTRYLIVNAGELNLAGPKLKANMNYTNYTGGMSFMYNVDCVNSQFICAMKQQLAFPILHAFGVVMCDEIINGTRRVNSITTVDKDKAKALKEDFEFTYKTGIRDVFNNIRLPNDICFKCNQAIKTISRQP